MCTLNQMKNTKEIMQLTLFAYYCMWLRRIIEAIEKKKHLNSLFPDMEQQFDTNIHP